MRSPGTFLALSAYGTFSQHCVQLRYDRVAALSRNGEILLDQLAEDETNVAPGLVYAPVGRAPF